MEISTAGSTKTEDSMGKGSTCGPTGLPMMGALFRAKDKVMVDGNCARKVEMCMLAATSKTRNQAMGVTLGLMDALTMAVSSTTSSTFLFM